MSHSTISAAELEEQRKAQIRFQIQTQIKSILEKNKKARKIQRQLNVISEEIVEEKSIIKHSVYVGNSLQENNESKMQLDLANINLKQSSFESPSVSNERKLNQENSIILDTRFDREKRDKEKILTVIDNFKQAAVLDEMKEEKEELLLWIENYMRRVQDNVDYPKEIVERIERFNKKLDERYDNSDEYIRNEYFILCDLLNEEPNINVSGKELLLQRERLIRTLQNQREREYIQRSINEVLVELGYEIEDTTVLVEDTTSILDGNLYANSTLKGSKLFVAMDGEEMVLETIADDISRGVSENSIIGSAKTICSHKKEIQQALEKRGVKVEIADTLVPELKAMYKLSSLKQEVGTSEEEMLRKSVLKERTFTYDE